MASKKAQTAKTAEAATEGSGGRSRMDTIPTTAAAKAAEKVAREMAKAAGRTKDTAKASAAVGTGSKGSKAGTKKAKAPAGAKAAGTGSKSKADAAAEVKQKKAVHTSASAAIRQSAEFASVRSWLWDLLGTHDPLIDAQVEEYMAFWVQRKLLAADVEERGVLVMDERGRLSENRNVSLGIQVSKQMQVLLQQLGLFQKKKGKAADADSDGEEEDEEEYDL